MRSIEDTYDENISKDIIYTCTSCLTQYETEQEAKDCVDSHLKLGEITREGIES